MGRQYFLGGVLGVLLSPSFLFAANTDSCPATGALARKVEKLPATPAPLKKLVSPARLPEVWRTGTVLEAGEKFPELPDDRYVFLVLNPTGKPGQEKIVFAPLVPEEVRSAALQTGVAPTKFLTTDQTLLRQLAQSKWAGTQGWENQIL